MLNRTEVFQQTFLHLGFLAQKHIRATVHFLFYSISKLILTQKSLRRLIVLLLNQTAFQIPENAPTQLLARVKLASLSEQQFPAKFQAKSASKVLIPLKFYELYLFSNLFFDDKLAQFHQFHLRNLFYSATLRASLRLGL